MQITPSHLKSILETIQSMYYPRTGHNEQLFLKRVYDSGITKYIERLQSIGFAEHERVLDAGCGYGQWSISLACLNQVVYACDISQDRLDFLRDLTCALEIANIELRLAQINHLPYATESFDAIFSYSVIFLTPWRKSLAEFARVLKPGGSLYINANSLGWYIYLWENEPNKADDYDPKTIAAKAFLDTLRYERDSIYEAGMNLIINPDDLTKELLKLGFENIKIGSEGTLSHGDNYFLPSPFLKGDHCGLTAVFEVLAKKQ